jgi:parallel beta-helix repeat protein
MGELLERFLLSLNEKRGQSNMKTGGKLMVICLFICLASLNLVGLDAKGQSAGAIMINADGSVSGTSIIHRQGNIYSFTCGVYDSPITVLRSNIILDGEGNALQGSGGWGTTGVPGAENTAAIDLSCSNVTVENFSILGWEVGVSGAYGNTAIINNSVSRTENAIAIYGDNCAVNGNSLTGSIYGVYVKGNGNVISQNQIAKNYCGIMLYPSLNNTIIENSFTDNSICLAIGTYEDFSYRIYENNFLVSQNMTVVTTTSGALGLGGGENLPPWDNGSVGNYWSDYAAKYPNASETENSGIGNTRYLISFDPTVIDRYPILKPVSTQNPTKTFTDQTSASTENASAVVSQTQSSNRFRQSSTVAIENSFTTATIIAVAASIIVVTFRNRLFWLQRKPKPA